MLMGEYDHALDDKGRLTVPARFREALGERFVLTVGLDGCLSGYPLAEWQQLTDRLRDLPMTNRDARAFMRLLLAGAIEVEPDKQGRILIPPRLRQAAEIENEAILVGVGARFEIWAAHHWRRYQQAVQGSFAETAEKLVDFSL